MAKHRHKRESRWTPRPAAIAAPFAVAATVATVGVGVALSGSGGAADSNSQLDLMAAGQIQLPAADSAVVDRAPVVSRSKSRLFEKATKEVARTEEQVKQTEQAIKQADTKLWAAEDLNLWSTPDEAAEVVGEVSAGDKVLVTGRTAAGRSEVVVNGDSMWVTSEYLNDSEPLPGLGGVCSNGSSVSSGVSPNVAAVHRAVCAAFPQITSYGTFRGDGEHARGIAIDCMISGQTGWDVANHLRAHYSELGISYIIYAQHIWSVERGGEGWRAMSDRGSVTANHYDHVHVTTY